MSDSPIVKAQNRIIAIDYIRVIALTSILICHSLLEVISGCGIAYYFAFTFNYIFLLISAFLFGLGWEKNGREQYGGSFLTGRLVKLSRSYYPYLAFLFIFLYMTDGYVNVRNVATHVMYLAWFDKINGFGHLWFMTMIVFCYFGLLAASRLTHISRGKQSLIYIVMIVLGLVADYIVSSRGLPGYVFPYLMSYVIVFRHARVIIMAIRRVNVYLNITQLVVVNAIGLYMFHNDLFFREPFMSYLVGMACAASMLCAMINFFSHLQPSRAIVWLSGISFEVYLVHEFFLGRVSVYGFIANPIVAFVAFVTISIAAAVILKKIAVSLKFGDKVSLKRSIM
ncbi:MAG: acyltransferase family protein [Duncaniella sp.]|nr:acyltransferase family protein [Duncaniella sp.]